jgi:sn-glycerol 3-phosphate transport system substrate-binding protein
MRLGGMLHIREEVSNALQEIFTNNTDVQTAMDDAAGRGNQILRRFEETYQGKQLP